jgi:hypothetical protein
MQRPLRDTEPPRDRPPISGPDDRTDLLDDGVHLDVALATR